MLDAAMYPGRPDGTIDWPVRVRSIQEVPAGHSSPPLKDWSLVEAARCGARLRSGESFLIPQDLVVLRQALFLVESASRTLAPDFRILDTRLAQSGSDGRRVA